MTGNIRNGIGVLAIAGVAGILWLLLLAAGADQLVTLAGAATIVCAVAGLFYIARDLLKPDREPSRD